MECRVWDDAENFFETFKNGDVAMVEGAAESYQGKVQLKLTRARMMEPDRIEPRHFLAACPFDIDELYKELLDQVNQLRHAELRGLVMDVVTDPELGPLLKRSPAAKRFHHAYVGGLLEHTVSVTRAALMASSLYPFLNRDLLVAGAVLHDVGKLREFDQGLAGDYSDEGRLLGHLLIGLQIVESKLAGRPDFPPDLALLVKHMIASHHGEYELGSPKKPKILEALALHHLDDLDAKMNGIGGFIQRHADERTGWTDYNRLMERYFFRPALPAVPENDEPSHEEKAAPPVHRADPNQMSFLQE
jgi:3'-5' exoribonuclease